MSASSICGENTFPLINDYIKSTNNQKLPEDGIQRILLTSQVRTSKYFYYNQFCLLQNSLQYVGLHFPEDSLVLTQLKNDFFLSIFTRSLWISLCIKNSERQRKSIIVCWLSFFPFLLEENLKNVFFPFHYIYRFRKQNAKLAKLICLI